MGFGAAAFGAAPHGAGMTAGDLAGVVLALSYAEAIVEATSDKYLGHLQALMPVGAAWPREADADLTRLLQALSHELERVEARGQALVEEADPRTTTELLADWERVTALPMQPAAEADRRAAVVARLTESNELNEAAFLELAETVGHQVRIETYRPLTCVSACNAALSQGVWAFAWKMITESGSNQALLESLVQAARQGHTHVLFEEE